MARGEVAEQKQKKWQQDMKIIAEVVTLQHLRDNATQNGQQQGAGDDGAQVRFMKKAWRDERECQSRTDCREDHQNLRDVARGLLGTLVIQCKRAQKQPDPERCVFVAHSSLFSYSCVDHSKLDRLNRTGVAISHSERKTQ